MRCRGDGRTMICEDKRYRGERNENVRRDLWDDEGWGGAGEGYICICMCMCSRSDSSMKSMYVCGREEGRSSDGRQ